MNEHAHHHDALSPHAAETSDHPELHESLPGSCPKCGTAPELAGPKAATRAEWTCPMHPDEGIRIVMMTGDNENGPWCGQSSTMIGELLKLGYPAHKLLWYRGGMLIHQGVT